MAHPEGPKASPRIFKEPPDFHWFAGDEQQLWQERATNELMFIRDVGKLRPSIQREDESDAMHNREVLDTLLISAVRASFIFLIRQLRHSFEVTLLHDFVFDLADGEWVELRPGHGFFTERVVGWHIEAAGS